MKGILFRSTALSVVILVGVSLSSFSPCRTAPDFKKTAQISVYDHSPAFVVINDINVVSFKRIKSACVYTRITKPVLSGIDNEVIPSANSPPASGWQV